MRFGLPPVATRQRIRMTAKKPAAKPTLRQLNAWLNRNRELVVRRAMEGPSDA